MAIIVILKVVIPEAYYPEVIEREHNATIFSPAPFFFSNQFTIHFAPNDPDTTDFMNSVKDTFYLNFINITFEGVDSAEKVQEMFDQNPDSIYLAVIFESPPETEVSLLFLLKYWKIVSNVNFSCIIPSGRHRKIQKDFCFHGPRGFTVVTRHAGVKA